MLLALVRRDEAYMLPYPNYPTHPALNGCLHLVTVYAPHLAEPQADLKANAKAAYSLRDPSFRCEFLAPCLSNPGHLRPYGLGTA